MVANLSSFYVELLTAVDSHITTRPDLARGTKGTKRGAPYYVMQEISAKAPYSHNCTLEHWSLTKEMMSVRNLWHVS